MGSALEMVASGFQRRYIGLIVTMGTERLTVILELGGIDPILGVEWRETLRDSRVDWKRKAMSFKSGGEVITLRG